jgi:hypothetical protein
MSWAAPCSRKKFHINVASKHVPGGCCKSQILKHECDVMGIAYWLVQTHRCRRSQKLHRIKALVASQRRMGQATAAPPPAPRRRRRHATSAHKPTVAHAPPLHLEPEATVHGDGDAGGGVLCGAATAARRN